MKIVNLTKSDLEACAKLLLSAYNIPPWNNQWNISTATKYLNELLSAKRFTGCVAYENNIAVGALFAHIRTWWTNEELFIDELYVHPAKHKMGYGSALLRFMEDFIQERGLSGIGLITDKRMPAFSFYEKMRFSCADHLVYLFKKAENMSRS